MLPWEMVLWLNGAAVVEECLWNIVNKVAAGGKFVLQPEDGGSRNPFSLLRYLVRSQLLSHSSAT